MKRLLVLGLLTILVMIGDVAASERPGREKTFRAYCRDASHGRRNWFTIAYTSMAPALMFAHKHNEENPGHDASVAIVRGAEPAHVMQRR